MKRVMFPVIFACISALALIGTAIFQYKEKISAENKADNRQIALDSANAKILDLQKKLNDKTEYISNYITGGKGFPYISFTDLKSEKSIEIAFIIYNDGAFPLYEVDCTMYNYNFLKQKEVNTEGFGDIFEKHPEYKIIKYDDYKSAALLNIKLNLPPKSMRYIDHKFPLKESKYCFVINTRNGTITERIAIIEDEDKKFLYIIEVFDSQENLLKRIVGKFVNERNMSKIETEVNKIPKVLKYVFVN